MDEETTDKLARQWGRDIIPSEALYGFAAWLTSLETTLKVGATHDAAEMAKAVHDWIHVNGLEPPREGIYPKNIKQPEFSPF